ncbi:MAG: ATP synthase F1 subunit gamma [Nitrospirae bacterium]|nr:ATP synthase F1 subunit gamma [Candidatus Troglogloeales bacterium]
MEIVGATHASPVQYKMAVLNYRGLLGRIRAAQKTQQITKTMQMVSASRLKKSHEKLVKSKPYFEKVTELLSHLQDVGRGDACVAPTMFHPFLDTRQEKSVALVVVTSDRGLCGAYNTNIISFAEVLLEKYPEGKAELILIGKKGDDYFKKRRWPIFVKYLDMAGKPDFLKISQITDHLTESYLSGRFDAVHLIYTAYRSALSIKPISTKLLPLEKEPSLPQTPPTPSLTKEGVTPPLYPKGRAGGVKTYLEPSSQEILNSLLPNFIASKIYVSLVEAFTAENSARMIAMKNATDNAKEMIRNLTLLRNKARQAAITKELLEIVTAGEALKG